MKLATLRNGRPDGQLVVVSANLDKFVAAGRIAPHLQAALDDWDAVAPQLERVYKELNEGAVAGQAFDPALAMAPLPRAYQWIDGTCYRGHLERVRSLYDIKNELQNGRPLMYQGGSDSLIGPNDPILVPADDLALDFEAELAAILGPVPMGASREQAASAIRLLALCNDVSLRRLVTDDLKNGFGFFHAKPATAFAPVVVTPDTFGPRWHESRLSVQMRVSVNDVIYGQPDAGKDMHFSFADLIAAASYTRQLGCGTIMGSGVVANIHDEVLPIKHNGIGFGCIAEARMVEKAKFGQARTSFLKPGDRVRLQAIAEGKSQFGVIDQLVALKSDA